MRINFKNSEFVNNNDAQVINKLNKPRRRVSSLEPLFSSRLRNRFDSKENINILGDRIQNDYNQSQTNQRSFNYSMQTNHQTRYPRIDSISNKNNYLSKNLAHRNSKSNVLNPVTQNKLSNIIRDYPTKRKTFISFARGQSLESNFSKTVKSIETFSNSKQNSFNSSFNNISINSSNNRIRKISQINNDSSKHNPQLKKIGQESENRYRSKIRRVSICDSGSESHFNQYYSMTRKKTNGGRYVSSRVEKPKNLNQSESSISNDRLNSNYYVKPARLIRKSNHSYQIKIKPIVHRNIITNKLS